ncbi:hypothetical protein LAZ67_13000529 [Cordylochernes scorpioides]|uniref:PiggyBac transposable element-derived protein domain-containing protein n=1 Tax=Cordylochernes scorpioides TaxID=51811 RepID=A0ABY6L318_9ARAC|nr:hypothetical protein LAZ67_13000529 [Cordylochernes scorpioides]
MDCNEIICDLSDTSDTEIYSYHDTDSEQNSEADEELPNDDSEFYFGKDGVTKWKKTMWQKTQIRTRSVNIISQLPGPKSEAKSIESESDAFTKIIDNDMVQKIVDCTNAYISNIKEHFSRERDAKLTTVTEILALFGLLIMSGVKRAAHLTYKELWAVDGSGVEAFVYNCKKLYTPGEYNTIDEKLIPFRGRCGFRQYMPNKPAKYGLKIYTISDARIFYTFNFEIYCGKQTDGPYKKRVTLDPSLTYGPHINQTVLRAKKRLNILKRISGYEWGADRETLRQTYLALIRPILEYAQPVWQTASMTNLNKIDQVEIEFTPHHNDQLFSARAFVVGRVTADLPNFQIQSADFPHLENLLLADPEFYVTKPIDLILGADTFVEIILGQKTDLKHHPIALNTKLGWLVSGRIHSNIKSNTSVINHCTTELDSSIRKFWELEDVPISKAQLGIKNAPSPSLQESIQNSPSLKEFTQNSPSLQESIQNSPSLKEFTQNFPSLPGSIQTSPSLRDSIQGSPSLTLSLQSSKHNSPTPLQVSVHSLKEAMSPLVEMPSSPGCSKQIPIPIEEDSIESQNRVDNLPSYPMSPELSYTLSSASVEDFKAQSGPKSPTSPTRGSESCRCSGDYTEPQMSQNSNFSCSSIEESEDNSSKSEENLSRSEDNPSKSEEIPGKSKKSRISKLTPQITSKQNQLLPSESSQPSTPEQPLASQSSEPLSSKKETSIIPKIKPPPYYRRKRQLPAEKTSWDEPIESDIKSNWNKFQTQLSCLKEIKIPRYLNSSSSEIEELQLHGFCDASLNAYSAVFYLKTRFKIQKIKINLITSKTKVAPLKTITIPRLELSAALLLAQLNQVILESFPFQPDKTFLWTDSQICIDWIRSDASRWKAFVSNRVSSIQNLTQITDWFHVSSQDNPADCASRGIMPQDLVNHRIWWWGPIWLQENNARYIPSSPTQVNLNIIQEEVGEGQVLDKTILIQNSETMLNLEFIERYSTMTKLIRITAWCWRFYYNCLLFDPILQKGPLTTRELTKAIQVLVKSIQQVEFCTEIKLLKSNKQLPLSNKLTSLNPFLDTQGLLRVGGRLKYSYLNENQKFPLLQPKSPRQESLIKNLLTENADIPEAIDENQEDSSILETTSVIEDEESNKDIGTPKIEISEVSVIDKSEGKYSKEPVVSVEALDKKELCHDDPAHLNVVEADLNRPKEATSGIINISTEANESASKEKAVSVEIVDTSTKDYLQSGEKAKLSRWKPIDSLCLEDVKESEDDDENYSSSAYIEWPEILKKEVLRPEALEKAVNLEDFEKAAESRQLSKEHLEESTEQGSCIKAESKPWEDPIESDLAAAEFDNPAVPERELANESENLIQDSPQSDTQRWKLIPLPFKQ